MGVRLTSTVVQIFARDVRRSIGFYRQLGLPVPEPEGPDPHVDVELPGGSRLSFDAEQTITGMHPGSLEPYDAPWGQRYATILDPDGNMVDLFALLAS